MLEPELPEQVREQLSEADEQPARAAFVARAVKAVLELAHKLEGAELSQAIDRPNDVSVLLRALEQPGTIELADDPLAAARARGVEMRAQLLNADGGVMSGDRLAKLLGTTRQTVDNRRQKGALLAVELGKRGFQYPKWQVVDGTVLPGLKETLDALGDAPPLAKMRFFLSENTVLDGKRPLDLLRKRKLDDVIRAARLFGEHGAP